MKNISYFKIFASMFLMSFLLTGCISVKTNESKKGNLKNLGGVFKSVDKGVTWKQKTLISSVTGRPGNFNNFDLSNFVFDPSDYNALYFGSLSSGLLYTFDGADSWQAAKGLKKIGILDVAVDPKDKCTIYVASTNKLFKTKDCNRTWDRVYFDNILKTKVRAVAVDQSDNQIVYIGLGRGDLIRSRDAGKSWQTIKRFNNNIREIKIDPNDSQRIFILTSDKGIQVSEDKGEIWETFSKKYKKLKIGNLVKDFIIFEGNPSPMYIATTRAIIKSMDNGENWERIELITPKSKSLVNSVAINPANQDEMYYVTNTTFFQSADGGANWTPYPLPTSRRGGQLLIDLDKPNILYMAIKNPPKK